MSCPSSSLPPSTSGVAAGGMVVSDCWPVAAMAAVPAIATLGLAWQEPASTTGGRWLAGLRTAELQQRALLAAFPGTIACIGADLRHTDANAHLATAEPGQAGPDGTAPSATPSAAPSATSPAAPSAAPPAAPPGTAPATTPTITPAPTPAAKTAPLRVLYIDDNPVNTLLMAAMFERLPGLALRCESDPHEGVAVALADPPALFLVDIQMPGLDGYQVLRLLRADPATRAVPAIAVSANAMPQDLARGQAAGFADYLTKPLELQRLQLSLQAALPGWVPPG